MSFNIGVAGLGVMGTNLSRNMGSRGYAISLYNRNVPGLEEKVAENAMLKYAELTHCKGFDDLKLFAEGLESPRIIFIMVHPGGPTEEIIQGLLPFLDPGDVLIDGGNTHYDDTTRRYWELKEKGIHFLGCGFSGGIDGALHGPSIMPGGSKEGFDIAAPLLNSLAAKAIDGSPCCTYIGPEGAGHFVKIVHNGIEYAEMQLLAEVYSLLRWAVGLTPDHIAEVLSQWKETDASGYLLDITLKILRHKQGDEWVIDSIVDSAGHKGTGVWAVQAAASFGIPAMMITASLHARYLSGQRHIRNELDKVTRSQAKKSVSMGTTDLFNAYQLARIINYHEGYSIIRAVSKQYAWDIDLAALSKIWTNGCIIRSTMMNRFASLWEKWDDELILHPDITKTITSVWPGLRRINQLASAETVFTPCLVAASQYIAGASLRFPSANLIQAQRDYFGSHGFWEIGDESGTLHHFPWNRE
jgi:6-phosphogluconate dehydrogenase